MRDVGFRPGLLETLAVTSYPKILSQEQAAYIEREISDFKRTLTKDVLAQYSSRSVHSVDGFSVQEIKSIYEPNGRFETTDLPVHVTEFLNSAISSKMEAVFSIFPSANRLGSWIYVEYGEGQFITPHIDCVEDPYGVPCQVAGISISLTDEYTGGEFVISTTAASEFFDLDVRDRVRNGADHTSDWFPLVAMNEWHVRPSVGDALIYGSQTVHSTRAVVSGVAKRFINFLMV